MFNIPDFFHQQFDEHLQVAQTTQANLSENFTKLANAALQTIQNGGKIVWFGNGGSASDAQHLATELVVRYRVNRRAIPSIALTTDTSALTAIGNDFGFEYLFSRQVEALCTAHDLVIGISTSGTSQNVIEGVTKAREMGCQTALLGGGDGGKLAELVDFPLVVPSQTTARIQEMHITLGQLLCDLLEQSVINSSII